MKKAEKLFPPQPAIVPRGMAGPAGRFLQAQKPRKAAVRGLGHKSKISFLAYRWLAPMPKNSSTAAPQDLPASYEAALQELEQLVARLESGQMPLEQLLAGYQRGAALLAFCKARLQAVEDQIKVLDGGQLKSWDAA